MKDLEKISRIQKFLELQKKNFEFITNRIEIQNRIGYTPFKLIQAGYKTLSNTYSTIIEIKELQYGQFDLDLIQVKIDKAKKYLENNS
jgi:stalled ribosome rescue protein Dom34